MGVNYGLVSAAETEAELVSVLSHEMAHSIELHSIGRETFGALVGLTAQVIEIGISKPGTKPGSNRIIGLGQNILMGRYSQSNELEADRVGVDLMVRAGFDSRGAVGMQEKLAKLGTGGNSVVLKLLGTHPISRERLAAIKSEVNRFAATGQSMSREFVGAQSEIKTLESGLKLVTRARKASAYEQFPKALQRIRRALKILPNEHNVWRLQAELLVANQEPNQAVQSALKVRELNPKDPISELLLGYCYAATGDTLNVE